MTVTRKGTREATATATAEEFLQSDHESVANGEEVEEDDSTLDSKKCKRDIANWIGRSHKPPSRNEDKEAEGEEEDVGTTQASTEDNSPIEKYEEGREYNLEDERKDTGLSDEKNTEEEASLRHKGEFLSSDLLDYDDNDDDDDETSAEDNNWYGNSDGANAGAGNGGGDRNTGAGGGSME